MLLCLDYYQNNAQYFTLKHTHTLRVQLEQEVDALNRKLKLLETDLDTAEDKAADQTDKVKELETQNEELLRENKQLQRRVDVLEGMIA